PGAPRPPRRVRSAAVSLPIWRYPMPARAGSRPSSKLYIQGGSSSGRACPMAVSACGFAVAGSDQALEPSYVRIQCRIAGLAGCDGRVGVIPLGQLLVTQVMEQPGGVAGRLTGDGSETAPQQ